MSVIGIRFLMFENKSSPKRRARYDALVPVKKIINTKSNFKEKFLFKKKMNSNATADNSYGPPKWPVALSPHNKPTLKPSSSANI